MPVNDYDDLLVGRYIRSIENPDSIGFSNGKWFQSPRKVDDPNNRGFGVDIKYNDRARELVKDREEKWLSEEEERDLRNTHIDYVMDRVQKWTPKVLKEIPSETKQAMVAGMLYRGDGIKSIIRNPAMRDAYYSGSDKDFSDAVENFYNNKNSNHYYPERARNHNRFMNTQHAPLTSQTFWEKASFKPISLFANGGFLQPQTAWDKLSMTEKAEMIKVAVHHGITNLQQIRAKYNEFAEGGSKGEGGEVNTDRQYFRIMEKVADENYQKWGFSNPDEALLHALNDNTYDYRGYYNKYPQSQANADTHWTDEFKTAYHPTFSRESVYSDRKSQYNPLGLPGGFWFEETFVPMGWQLGANKYKKGGGIHIKDSKKGTFTAAASRHNMGVQEFASKVLANKDDYSPAMVKKANFARNFGGKKKSYGGYMEGGIYDINIEELNRLINNGYEIELL